MVTLAETKTEFNNWISDDATVSFLEKAQSGKTTLEDIADALDEYKRLHDAGLSSPAEIITLARAYPQNKLYTEAADGLDEDEDTKPMVVGGPASVELVDREGHLITTDALKKAFKQFMKNFRARNVMVMHSDVQVGHALPAYISKSGNIFKSGVDEKGLFFISELRADTKISKRVRDQIEKGGMSSYSIAGSATQSKEINKSDGSHVLQVDDMELAEVTICEKGVNQGAHFELLKGDKAEGSCADGSCFTDSSPPTIVQTEYIAISKGDINHIDMFNSWISKAPMMAGAAGKLPKAVTPPKPANVTGNIGMPVKMSMDKKKEEVNPYAIATAMAKKKGFKNFSEDSKGDKYRDKITEGIKETTNMKKEFLSKDNYDETKDQKLRSAAKDFLTHLTTSRGGKTLGGKKLKRQILRDPKRMRDIQSQVSSATRGGEGQKDYKPRQGVPGMTVLTDKIARGVKRAPQRIKERERRQESLASKLNRLGTEKIGGTIGRALIGAKKGAKKLLGQQKNKSTQEIVKEVFKGQVWDVVSDSWVSKQPQDYGPATPGRGHQTGRTRFPKAGKATPPTAKDMGTARKESTAKLAGKVLSQAGLGRSGRGRGTIGATERALVAIGRNKPEKKAPKSKAKSDEYYKRMGSKKPQSEMAKKISGLLQDVTGVSRKKQWEMMRVADRNPKKMRAIISQVRSAEAGRGTTPSRQTVGRRNISTSTRGFNRQVDEAIKQDKIDDAIKRQKG